MDLDEAKVRPVFGVRDANLRALEAATGARISARGGSILVEGAKEVVPVVAQLLEELASLIDRGLAPRPHDLEAAARMVLETPGLTLSKLLVEQAVAPTDRRRLIARTPTQQAYVHAIRTHDMVFGIGPAGTGKTYLAVAMALEALKERSVRRIVLTRPAVEAGERLGFLPGDLIQKINPYLRPLNDAIRDLADADLATQLLERGDLEVAPLAFMRGRTLNDAFIILDEAQNTTREQMKMFLTRMGFNSKVVVTGDPSQVDLPQGRGSGLDHAGRILARIPEIAVVQFTKADVVRHGLVRRIVEAYEKHEGARRPPPAPVPPDDELDGGDDAE